MRLARTPGVDVVAHALDLPRRVGTSEHVGFGRAVYDASGVDPDIVDEYLRPVLAPEGRERARRFLLAGDVRSDDPADVRPPSDPYKDLGRHTSQGGIVWVFGLGE